jgi:hypothetical protein
MAFNPNQDRPGPISRRPRKSSGDEVFFKQTRASTEHCEVAVAFDGRPVLADKELARNGFS